MNIFFIKNKINVPHSSYVIIVLLMFSTVLGVVNEEFSCMRTIRYVKSKDKI